VVELDQPVDQNEPYFGTDVFLESVVGVRQKKRLCCQYLKYGLKGGRAGFVCSTFAPVDQVQARGLDN